MSTLTPAALRKQITAGALDPVYLVLGDDEHEKAELATECEEVVEEGLRAFNVERFRGGEVPLGTLLDALRTLPMMVPRRIVTGLRAERWLMPKRESQATARDLEALERYLERPVPDATLVLVVTDLDERRRISKRLHTYATIVRCGELENTADAERWIRARLKAAGVAGEPAATRLLAAVVGPDVSRLRGEVERLVLYAMDQPSVSVDDVRAVVGPAAAHDDWAVARAIERGAAGVALQELALALDAGAPPHMVLGQLAWVARSRLAAPWVRGAIDAVFRTDLDLKRSAGEPRVLLERLVVELCGKPASRSRGGSH